MRKTYVFDAHALFIFLEKEKGYEQVTKILSKGINDNSDIRMTAVNIGEILYIILRECGKNKLFEIEHIIKSLPIEIVNADYALAKEAARFKAFKKMSYADCFSAALAKMVKGELVTGDPEFKEVEKEIKIQWL